MSYVVISKPKGKPSRFDCGSPELVATEEGEVFFEKAEDATRLAKKHVRIAPSYEFIVHKVTRV